jgi:hypothetical protein
MSEKFLNNSLYFLCGLMCMTMLNRIFEVHTKAYHRGVDDTMQEAFENGLAQKELTPENQVVLRWIETHKLGYEN